MSLTREQWALVEELFPQALALPPDQREAFLRSRCPVPEARAEIEALLVASGAGDRDDFLSAPVVLSDRSGRAEMLQPGLRLGAWEVEGLIGRGGMGEVYAALRADGQFEMPAAIKVLKRGLDTEALLERFARERRILARLSHPGIAHLLDAGATADGRPYYVMERVAGVPITEYCAARALAVPAILRLMREVCAAAGAAHRANVVHRDLKPSNILVTSSGEVKLLDFGIAKLIGDDEGEQTRTVSESRLLTPEYAAPEQILGEPVSTATDVYALGALLYRLLTGRPPHQRESTPIAAIASSLRDEAAVKPSTAARRAGDRTRAKALAGDVDLIVLKALHAEPQRRYRSALELSEDLERLLEHRPVLARPDSMRYRARRFVQRYPIPVSAASVAIVALAAGLGVALWQARIAREEAQRAERVKDFLVSTFEQADPERTQGETITARQWMEHGQRQLQARIAEEPAVHAELAEVLGQINFNLGRYAQSIALAETSANLRRSLYGDVDPRVAASLQVQGQALIETRQLSRAVEVLSEADRIYGLQGDRGALDRARLQNDLSYALSASGRAAEGMAMQEAAVATFARLEGPDHEETANAIHTLGLVYETAGEYRKAEDAYGKSLALLAALRGNEHSTVAELHRDLAALLDRVGRSDEADPHFQKAIAIQRKIFGPDSPRLANTLFSRAVLLISARRFGEADQTLLETLRIYPAGSYRAAQSQRYLGLSLIRQERYPEAIGYLEAAAKGFRASGGADDPQQYRALADAALARLRSGAAAEALAPLREAVTKLESITGPESYEVRNPLKTLGEDLLVLKRYQESADVLRRVRDLELKLFDDDEHRDLAATHSLLGEALLGIGDEKSLAEARIAADRALYLQRKQQAPEATVRRTLDLSATIASRSQGRK